MIKKWNKFIREFIENSDSLIDAKMSEIKDLIDSVGGDHNLLYEWENKNNHEIIINFNWDDLSIRYEFSIDNMIIVKIVSEQVDFQENVESIDEALDIIEKDIHSIIGISESKRIYGRKNMLRFGDFLNESRKNVINLKDFIKELKSFNSDISIDVPDSDLEINTLNNKEFAEIVSDFKDGKYDNDVNLLSQRIKSLLSRPVIKSMMDLLKAMEKYDKGFFVSDVLKQAMRISKVSGSKLDKLIKLYNKIPRAHYSGGQLEYRRFMDKLKDALKKENLIEPTRTLSFWRMNFYDDGNTSFTFSLPKEELESVKKEVDKYFKSLSNKYKIKDNIIHSYNEEEDVSGSVGITYYPELYKIDHNLLQETLDEIKKFLIELSNDMDIEVRNKK